MTNGNMPDKIRRTEPTKEEAEHIVEQMLNDLIAHKKTPMWTHPVLEQTRDAGHTYPLVHLREDVRLLIRIMERGNEEEDRTLAQGQGHSQLDAVVARVVQGDRKPL